MANLPSFMLSQEQREAAAADEAEFSAFCEAIAESREPGAEPFDTLPYHPDELFGTAEEWGPNGQFYWSRVFKAARNKDMYSLNILLGKSKYPKVLVHRCNLQALAIIDNETHREEIKQCLQTALVSSHQ